MGVFDTLEVNCPNCGTKILIQSKSGDCSMSYAKIGEDPVYDLNFVGLERCGSCKELFEIKNTVLPVVVAMKYVDTVEDEQDEIKIKRSNCGDFYPDQE